VFAVASREIERKGGAGFEASGGGDDDEEAEAVVQCEVVVEGEAAVEGEPVVGKSVVEGGAVMGLKISADDADGYVCGSRGAGLLAANRVRFRGRVLPSCCGAFCFVHADAGC
jgi:hypothetical protein